MAVLDRIEFFEDDEEDRVVLIVRCGGRHGKCGKVQAAILDDESVRYADVRCHSLDEELGRDRNTIVARAKQARVAWGQARRSGRPFNPPSVTARPDPRYAREDRGTRDLRDGVAHRIDAWADNDRP
jgi:hypothetical protein